MKKNFLSTTILLITAIVWGSTFVAQVLGSRYVDAFTFNAGRFLLGTLVLLPVCLIAEKRHESKKQAKATMGASLICGSIIFIASALQQYGIASMQNPGKAGFITGIYIVITPILYSLIFRRKSGKLVWIGAILSTLGLYLLCFDGNFAFPFGKGELLVLLGSVFWAIHIIGVDYYVSFLPPLKFACGQFFIAGLWNLAAAFLFGSPTWDGIWQARWSIICCGVLATGIGFTFQVLGQKMSQNPTYAAILLSTESIFSVLAGLLWNMLPISPDYRVDASMSVYGIFGCIIIFVAIILSQISQNNSGKPKKSLRKRRRHPETMSDVSGRKPL